MASGFGYAGGRSRCFAFWQDFSSCYSKADMLHECVQPRDDYLECLHRTKEISKAMKIKSQYLTKTKVELDQKRKEIETTTDSGILGLGLLQRPDEAQPST
ncbi:BZ3500_MvSof-1268-A1-R1_Chr3-2g06337 [Microbotryum saponariae]|uniref:NADH dehydrogenase [ubiquinone] iron-sulfur protein 5 n=1 Tax=Microbotryum saponariae TaxID=289078 RepID=A0A2X0KVY4_9BASI|nr:BZ3500_MvSof-1268-A1-R1_Chr3-2g06337 [Microbotryum saponariae]SDA04308.1 BZ3501_MvSof-1269-A2-R1_Chr3-2g06028 [Microbotryum saponariae]